MEKISTVELARFNGKNGAKAYIAYEGNVYDVTDSYLWLDGEHQVLHDAGADLTDEMDEAPHGEELLEQFPVVGMLSDE